jgi:hypothetical protein
MLGWLHRAADRHGVESRERKWELYQRKFPPRRGERVLDVGVSQLDDLPGENYFLRKYPFSDQLTAVGVDDQTELRVRYPEVNFVQADGRDLPFGDKSFDVVHSNAVLEHVGPKEEQRRFVTELVRVAHAGFITTPNQWFLFETHTRVPVLHWLPRRLSAPMMVRFGHQPWRVWLLSSRSLRDLFPRSADVSVQSQRFVGWPATLIALFDTRHRGP